MKGKKVRLGLRGCAKDKEFTEASPFNVPAWINLSLRPHLLQNESIKAKAAREGAALTAGSRGTLLGSPES